MERLYGTPAAKMDEVVVFKQYIVGGSLYVTASARPHEFAICKREDDPSVVDTLKHLLRRTRGQTIRSGDIIDDFLVEYYGTGWEFDVLLAIGITEEEKAMCLESGSSVVIERLRGAGIFPFTEERETVSDDLA